MSVCEPGCAVISMTLHSLDAALTAARGLHSHLAEAAHSTSSHMHRGKSIHTLHGMQAAHLHTDFLPGKSSQAFL